MKLLIAFACRSHIQQLIKAILVNSELTRDVLHAYITTNSALAILVDTANISLQQVHPNRLISLLKVYTVVVDLIPQDHNMLEAVAAAAALAGRWSVVVDIRLVVVVRILEEVVGLWCTVGNPWVQHMRSGVLLSMKRSLLQPVAVQSQCVGPKQPI